MTPEISAERPKLLTEWYRTNGFAFDKNGKPWTPTIRHALALSHLMQNKKPVIQKDTCWRDPRGPKMFQCFCILIQRRPWFMGGLKSISSRVLKPHNLSKENLKFSMTFYRSGG